jgi:hypothetical protein
VIRACLICPECIEAERVTFASDKPRERTHTWQFYMNGTFCTRCGVSIGTPGECR